MLELAFNQLAIGKLLTRVAPRPFAGDKGLDQIKLTCLEAFKLCRVVFVESVGDAVKVEHTHTHVELAPPVVWVTVVTDISPKNRGASHIGATGNRKLGDDFVEGLARGTVLLAPTRTEYWHGANDQGQFRVGTFEFKTHGSRV